MYPPACAHTHTHRGYYIFDYLRGCISHSRCNASYEIKKEQTSFNTHDLVPESSSTMLVVTHHSPGPAGILWI